ncbi:unnamed protein product, partial [Chrysoparadoxa australica]
MRLFPLTRASSFLLLGLVGAHKSHTSHARAQGGSRGILASPAMSIVRHRGLCVRGGCTSVGHEQLSATLGKQGLEEEKGAAQEDEPVVQSTPALRVAETVQGGYFGKFISHVFHIEAKELQKFFTMSAMMFCIIYVFTMTRDTKDTLIVTNCGAESIAFLKVYGVVPAAALFMIGYNFLSNHVSSHALFCLTLVPFFIFYTIFGFVLYPMRDRLHHPGGPVSRSENRLSYLINLERHWTFSLYYIVSELWGSAGIPLLFWTMANQITPIAQAKRFYPLFGLLGNLAPIASGQTMIAVRNYIKKRGGLTAEGAFEGSIRILTGFMCGAGVIILGLYEMLQRMHRKEVQLLGDAAKGKGKKKPKPKAKMSFKESSKLLLKSHYLGFMAVMVLSYGLCMEFTEIIWKSIVKLKYPDKSDYMAFMGEYSKIVGASTFGMLLFGNKLIKYLGWEFGALMTPVMMAIMSAPFFGYLTVGDVTLSEKALGIAVLIGTVQNILSKATKYALFDPCKEMAYIPL